MNGSGWTIPNLITVGRILLVPGFVMAFVNHRFDLAWVIFAVAGASDALDGILARILKQRSRLGSILDPLADKLLLDTSFICLAMLGWLPRWLAVLVVSRDVIIVGGLFLIHYLGVDVRTRIKPTWVGKATTLAQILLVLWVMCEHTSGVAWQPLRWSLFGLAALLTLWSEIDYVLIGLGLLPGGANSEETGRDKAHRIPSAGDGP